MTDDENQLCGSTETGDGSPCSNAGTKPDGRCYLHTDIEEERVRPEEGRPTKLDDDVWNACMEAAERGLTYEGIARSAGVGVSTLREWRNDNDEFHAELERKRARGEMELVEATRETRPEFILERSYGYTKEQEIELSGGEEIGGLSPEDKELLDDMFDRDPQETDDE